MSTLATVRTLTRLERRDFSHVARLMRQVEGLVLAPRVGAWQQLITEIDAASTKAAPVDMASLDACVDSARAQLSDALRVW